MIHHGEGTAALNQEECGLILGIGAEILQPQDPGGHGPSEGHELVRPGCGAGVASGIHHPVGVAMEAGGEGAAEQHLVTHRMAVHPGAFRITDRVEHGPTFRSHAEHPGGGGQGRQVGHLVGLGGLGKGEDPGLGRIGSVGRRGDAQGEAGGNQCQSGTLKNRQNNDCGGRDRTRPRSGERMRDFSGAPGVDKRSKSV